MLEQISQTLSKPFPFSQNSTQGAGISAFFGVFIFVFLAIFQPYGLSEITTHKYMFLFGYGVITFCVIFCTSVLLSYTLNKTIIEKWTVGRSISLISLEILLIGLLNWTYTFLFGDENINHYSLLDFVLFTMEVALIPSGFFIILFERLLQRKNKEKASILSSTLSTPKVNNDQKTKISLGLNQHQFTVDLSKLLCIKAQGNYMEVYYLLNESIKKQLVRQTLSGISKQLLEDTSLKQCHRSYVVNFDKIEKVTGNARNFNLHLKDLEFSIPVSRKFPISTFDQFQTSQPSIKTL